MNTHYHRVIRRGIVALLALSSFSLYAASPTIQLTKPASVVVGESVLFHADVADTDGNLQSTIFYVAGPGISGWQTVATRAVSGASAASEVSWSPSTAGVYTLRVDVVDSTTGSSAQAVFEAFAERKIVTSRTLASGTGQLITSTGEIQTQENQSGISVYAASGSNLVLWAGGRIVLKPGFKAQSGSFFWAAVDHNNNGYSDMEEATDTDGDGLPDAWEFDHGLNMLNAADAAWPAPGLGMSYLQAYQAGKDPGGADSASPNFDTRDNDADGIPNSIKVQFGMNLRTPAMLVQPDALLFKINTPR